MSLTIDDRKFAIALANSGYIYNRGYYERDEEGKRLKTYIKGFIFPDLITITRINRVYNLILVDYSLTKENEDVNDYPKYWVNFKNGMYDPIMQEMHPHNPEYYATKQTNKVQRVQL